MLFLVFIFAETIQADNVLFKAGLYGIDQTEKKSVIVLGALKRILNRMT
jgi:hypothetical protein